MRVKLGSIVTEASGRLGGFVASKTGSTLYLKSQPSVSNSQSQSHNLIKDRTSLIMTSWRQLTDNQRFNWNNSAKSAPFQYFGKTNPFRSGFSFFCAINQIRLLSVQSLLTDPPIFQQPFEVSPIGLTITVGSLDQFILNYSGPGTGPNRYQVFATNSLSPSISFIDKRFKQLDMSRTSITSGTNYYSRYTDVFGVPVVGAAIHVKMRWFNRNTCSMSPFIQMSTIVLSV